MISKHPRLTFFSKLESALRTALVIHYNIHCINIFLAYYAYANSEESGTLRFYSRSTWSMISFHTLDFWFK